MRISDYPSVYDSAIRKLASGLRINQAADDPAGLVISEKMRSQTGGLSQAIRNAQDEISMLQTKDAALASVQDTMQQMRELSVQAQNGTYTAEDRAIIQDQYNQLQAEVEGIAANSQYNNQQLIENPVSGASLDSIDSIDQALESVSSQRSTLGAEQNRLEHSIKSEMVAHENLSAAESRIRDADMALEMMQYVKQEVLNKSGLQVHSMMNRAKTLMLLTE